MGFPLFEDWSLEICVVHIFSQSLSRLAQPTFDIFSLRELANDN